MALKVTGTFPLGTEYTTEDGRFEVWEAKEGSGHMLRYPNDPKRFVVSKVIDDKGAIHFGLGRFETMAEAEKFISEQ